ncbi:MAG: hypothetical protein ACLVJU_13720 [Blautia sp.]
MSKKKGEGLKSFNRGFNVPDTYIIIFFVVVIAAVMTFLVPKGYYETEDVTYLMNGVEKDPYRHQRRKLPVSDRCCRKTGHRRRFTVQRRRRNRIFQLHV